MRAVGSAGELDAAWRMATSEASSAFGAPDLFLEKLVEHARHVEMQLIADDRGAKAKVEILQSFAVDRPLSRPRQLNLRFLVSPVELFGEADGCVTKMKLVRNTLVASETGTLSAKATDQFEELEVGMVFRSVGYRGVALPDVPFNDRWGVILNERGRVIDPASKHPIAGLYTSGWIKRGPSGVVGTNKPDSVESVTCMLEDFSTGSILQPANADAASAISGAEAFNLFETYGFPIELTRELASEGGLEVDEAGFQSSYAAHRQSSRDHLAQKYAGGLADHTEQTTRLRVSPPAETPPSPPPSTATRRRRRNW